MQLSDILIAVKDLLDESGVRRSDEDLTATINEGYRLVAVVTQACETSHSWRATVGSFISSLPKDFYTSVGVYFNGTRLYPIRMGDLDDLDPAWLMVTPGVPVYYTTVGALTPSPQLGLYPAPAIPGTIKMSYAATPKALVYSADIPQFPREHHYVLVWWTYAWELLKERGALLANKSYQIYGRFLEEAGALQQYVYRRTPDRDWVSPPLDAEAVRRKLMNIEQAQIKGQQGTEAQVMGQ